MYIVSQKNTQLDFRSDL